jgi:hypothetical protein
MPSLADDANAAEAPQTKEGASDESEIDLQALAEKVYALLKQELRVERERLVRTKPW